jgi:hypothetical protein
MARYFRSALHHVKIHSRLPVDVDQLARQAGHVWRDRKLTPAVTVRLFMLQILNGNLAMTGLHRIGGVTMRASSYCAARMRQGVYVVMRLHQRRPVGWTRDARETWRRPVRQPDWMSESTWRMLPEELTVRIVRYTVNRKGCRTRQVYVATSLLNPLAYPAETIMRLYGHRWQIETCFNQLKTGMRMNTLKSQTVQGVIKELMMCLIVWNLVRMTMMTFGQRTGVSAWRISVIDTVRCLCVLMQATPSSEVDLLVNPDRPDRWEPRKLKRRIKEYDLLNEPRQRLKAKHRARYA